MLIAGGVFFLYTQPSYDTVQASQVQIDQYNQALDKAAELQQLKQTLLSRYNSFDPNSLDRLQKLLPDHVDNIALILDLDSIATRYGLALQNVDISTATQQGSATQTALGAIGSASQTYDSLTLTFSTEGSYASFVQFITDLEDSLRIVDLASLSISRAAGTTGSANGTTAGATLGGQSVPAYTYTISLRTYWLK